jgi:hypothetical protein
MARRRLKKPFRAKQGYTTCTEPPQGEVIHLEGTLFTFQSSQLFALEKEIRTLDERQRSAVIFPSSKTELKHDFFFLAPTCC